MSDRHKVVSFTFIYYGFVCVCVCILVLCSILTYMCATAWGCSWLFVAICSASLLYDTPTCKFEGKASKDELWETA